MLNLNFAAAIFDLDGTLLDSLGVWQEIDIDFLTRRGLEVPPDYAEAINAFSFRGAAEYTIARFGLADSVDELISEWYAMAVDEYSHNVALKPYAKEYLQRLKEQGIKLAVATSAPAALYQPSLKRHGISDFFAVICSTEHSPRGKAYPDVFLQTAEELGIAPEHCLVFEDIPQAIRSAKQAGMTVCGVYDEYNNEQWPEITDIADIVINDFRNAPRPYLMEN